MYCLKKEEKELLINCFMKMTWSDDRNYTGSTIHSFAAFEGKELKFNPSKTKVVECGGGSGVVLARINPCSVCVVKGVR